jgi:hypothetical protein
VLTTNQLIRRYTSPTCTLEIQGKSSLLSRWKGSNIVRNLWFQLSFDDRGLQEVERVKICGDRLQLEELCEAVGEYIQKFLARTSWDDRTFADSQTSDSDSKPYFKQKGMLDRELYFTSIGGKKERQAIELSSTQLFDLANVLEEFASDITLLPIEKDIPVRPALTAATTTNEKQDTARKETEKPKNPRKIPSWASAAASFAVASGVTFAGMRLYYQSQPQGDTPVAVNATTNNPTPNQTPTNQMDKNSGVPLPPATTTIPIPNNTLPPSLSPQNTPPPPPSANQTQTQQNTNSNSNSQGESLGKPQNTPPPKTPTTTPTTTQNQQTGGNRNTNNPKTQSSPKNGNTNDSNTSNNNDGVVAINIDKTPPTSNENSSTNTQTETTKPVEEDKVFSGYTPNSSDTSSETTVTGDALSTTETIPNAPTTLNRSANNPAIVSSNTQVEEVQKYFQGKWQPPEGLAEPLEYTLSIGNDGSIQSITPVGKAAATYLDRTNMPLLNESFVSPTNITGSTKVRLLLNPDGTVKTFSE